MMIGLNIGNSYKCGGQNTNWWDISYPGALLAAEFSNHRAMLNDSVVEFADFLTITRNSDGYCENSDGSLTKYTADEFRLCDRGLLIESASSNLVLYSQDITASPWILIGNAARSINSTSAPDNSMTASLVSNMISDGDGIIYTDSQSTNIGGKTVTFSVYLKGSISGQIECCIEAQAGSGGSSSILFSIGTEWQRFAFTHTFAADDTDFSLSLKRPSGGAVPQVYVWGTQLEEKNYATSYIETNGSIGNRAADDIYFHDLSWLNASTGTLLMDVQSDHGTLSNRRLLGFASAQGLDTSPLPTVIEEWNGTTLLTASSGDGSWVTGAKVALAWDLNGRSLCMEGGNVSSDSETVNGLSNWYLGSRDGTQSIWEGYQRSLVYWDHRKDGSSLVNLSI